MDWLMGLLGAAAAWLAFVWSSAHAPSAVSTRIWDRVLMLDRTALEYPAIYAILIAEANRPTLDYFETGDPADTTRIQLKALVYLNLNVFDEIYLAMRRSRLVRAHLDAPGWEEWILQRMKHPLLREVFEKEIAPHAEHSRFVAFYRANLKIVSLPYGTSHVW